MKKIAKAVGDEYFNQLMQVEPQNEEEAKNKETLKQSNDPFSKDSITRLFGMYQGDENKVLDALKKMNPEVSGGDIQDILEGHVLQHGTNGPVNQGKSKVNDDKIKTRTTYRRGRKRFWCRIRKAKNPRI